MRAIVTSVLIFFTIISPGQIGAKKHAGNITGTWINDAQGLKLILTPQGTGEFREEAIKYVKHNDKLHVSKSDITTIYTCQINGDELILSGGDLKESIMFKRGIPVATGLTQQEISEYNIPKELLGFWIGYNETIEFKPDAQCIYRDRPWPYLVSADVITLQTVQGNFIMHYKITGKDLHLSFGGADHIYQRQQAADSVATKPTHALDTTLIGKWCYGFVPSGTSISNTECFYLNSDGTYVYTTEAAKSDKGDDTTQSSDTGLWWREGTQLFLDSNGQGRAAYTIRKMNHSKTGDPMIVLNGKNYISYERRRPW